MLYQCMVEAALEHSTQAIKHLKQSGIMSALRIEEILYNHYLVLKAAKHEQEASDYIKEAYAIVQEKAETISNPVQKQTFLERVPVSKAIVMAFQDILNVAKKDLGESAKNVDEV